MLRVKEIVSDVNESDDEDELTFTDEVNNFIKKIEGKNYTINEIKYRVEGDNSFALILFEKKENEEE